LNAYIKAILLFNEKGEKRGLELREGLNIITGESKSGKSALLEIIDYCFGSSNSTIPKGRITEFTYLYSIILRVNDTNVVIGRKSFSNKGRNNMFLKIERKEINFGDLDLDYYEESYFIQRSRAIREIENILGLTVTDVSEDAEQKKEGRPSIRNMMSYLLQHQNLIASKFALFYRFDDSRKRDQVISQFPIFAGWVDQKYYSYKYRLDLLLKELKIKEKEITNNKKYLEKKKKRLLETFNNYFMLIGEKLNQDLSLDELLSLRDSLPDFQEEGYMKNELKVRYQELKNKLEEKKAQKHKYELLISNLEESENFGHRYMENLEKLKSKANVSEPRRKEYLCPLCGNGEIGVNQEVSEVIKSIEWLEKEISEVDYHRNSYREKINEYEIIIYDLDAEIRGIMRELKEIEQISKEILDGKAFNEQVIYAKAKIDLEVEMLSDTVRVLDEEELDNIKNTVEDLEEKIAGYNLDTYYAEAKTFINQHINRIVNKLDFEEEFKPPRIVFDLEETFDLYHWDMKNNSRIYLSEMGSGANWLACHLGLFLSLLRYFCSQKKSPMPKFLFFDQPSQVYFPDTSTAIIDENQIENKDIIAVKKIYESVLNEIDDIYKDTGIKPQVIITDHVKDLNLENYTFKDYIRKSWFEDKLI
jgi:hypothetical protein